MATMPQTSELPADARTSAAGIAPPTYRLPPDTRLGPIDLQVADLDRSLVYYEKVLGFRVVGRTGESAMLAALGDDMPLVQLHERRDASPVPQRGRLGLYHFAVLLPDRPALGRLVAHLVEIGLRVGASDHLVSEAVYLRDPDGLGIEVYADRPRSAWRTVDRQLRMDTAPLNLGSVIEAGGEVPWTGMPVGARMGHVHLHVGDLEQAAAFYHAALGLDKVVWSYPGALFLSAGGYHHHLGLNSWAGADARSPTAADARLLEWSLELPTADDVAAAGASIEAAGYGVQAADGGLRVADPWGTTLRLVRARTPQR
jgi:catechol 2,3-dioxygenase